MIVSAIHSLMYYRHVKQIKIVEGTTQMVSKLWMPLDEWTQKTMQSLLSIEGNGFSAVGDAKEWFDEFEKGKLEKIRALKWHR
jgi:hypothetical protein